MVHIGAIMATRIEKLKIELIDLYLSFLNDYLTTQHFAESHGLSFEVAGHLLISGRELIHKYYVENGELYLRNDFED